MLDSWLRTVRDVRQHNVSNIPHSFKINYKINKLHDKKIIRYPQRCIMTPSWDKTSKDLKVLIFAYILLHHELALNCLFLEKNAKTHIFWVFIRRDGLNILTFHVFRRKTRKSCCDFSCNERTYSFLTMKEQVRSVFAKLNKSVEISESLWVGAINKIDSI